MATVKRELTTNFTSGQAVHHNKISSIGPGFLVWSVQSASYYKVFPAPHQLGLLGLGDELVFVDADEGTLMGETMDLHHGSPFVKTPNVVSSKDYLVTADSIVAIVTAAARQWISNSCSLEAECTSLKLCIGSGCNLDTARSRFLIGQRLGIRSESCHGLILGEHGDSSEISAKSLCAAHGALLRSVPLQDPSSHTGTAKDPGRREGVHGQVVARSTSFHVITFTF